MQRLPDLVTGLRLAWRARFPFLSLWLTLTLIATVWMAAQFSGRQPATVALDVGLSLIRLVLPLVGILLLQELYSREFDRRLYLSSLTYPRPRYRFLLERLGAIFLLLFTLLVLFSVVLGVMVALIGRGYAQATPVALGYLYLITIFFISIDVFVILTVGVFLAIISSTPSFVLIGAIGFMLVARSFSSIVALLQRESYLVSNAEYYGASLSLLGYLVPDLAAIDVREMALYGQASFLPQNWANHLLGALAYALGFVGLALWALARKRFS